MLEALNNRKRSAGNTELSGFFRGEVEYNLDPMSLGRCKVRIFSLHRTDRSIPTLDLPWAFPCVPFSGPDYGDLRIPEVGERVWCGFEMGHRDRPIYFGSWTSITPESRQLSVIVDSNGNQIPSADVPISISGWNSDSGLETPRESQVGQSRELKRSVSKTAKGHTFIRDDRDTGESLSIIDRTGQVIHLEGSVTSKDNQGNNSSRGINSILNGKPVDNSKLVGKSSKITISDAASQSFQLIGHEGQEGIRLKSTTFDDKGTPSSGGDRQVIDLSSGLGRGLWEIVKGNKVVGRIIYEGTSGNLIMECDQSITLRSNTINLSGQNVNVTGRLIADSILSS